MIVDTSAVMAILLGEDEAQIFAEVIGRSPAPRWSVVSAVELQAVLTRRFRGLLDEDAAALIGVLRLAPAPVTIEQSRIASDAYRNFGIGSDHPARLNFGDCFAYALSKSSGEPLLFKGDDFAATDIVPAI
ncbi:hypothetical protein ASG07_02985 [Sphingomonas sp. Leaf343]|nr:hypothetical protein ASG07_02985 [Sphingomonas sp. Leaf343]